MDSFKTAIFDVRYDIVLVIIKKKKKVASSTRTSVNIKSIHHDTKQHHLVPLYFSSS